MFTFFASAEFQTVFAALNTGFARTLQLFFVTLVGAIPLGLVISLGSMNTWTPFRFLTHLNLPRPLRRAGGLRPISLLCRFLVWIVRGTPLVLQIIALFFIPSLKGFPIWGGSMSGRFAAVAVAFIINYACYFSEIYRGGIQSVPAGQQEAGLVLGMTRSQIFFRVTLLQMIKRIVPPLSNEIITLVKDTSLARVIALQEVIWMSESFLKGNQGYAGLIWPLFFTAVYYLVFSGIVTILLSRLEKKLEFFR